MPNPFAPRVSRRTQPEAVSQLDGFLERMRLLGATDEEVASVRDSWDDFSDGWTVEARDQLLAWDDEKLRDELLALRGEHREATTTEDDDLAAAADSAVQAARDEAHEQIGKPVAAVLEWVGTDALRAIAILDLETGPDGAERKTLVEPLRSMLEPANPEGADGTAG